MSTPQRSSVDAPVTPAAPSGPARPTPAARRRPPGLLPRRRRTRGAPPRWLVVGGLAVVLGCAVALRFLATSELWLDETLTVNIARQGVPGMFEALSRDGHPPLFYLLLWGWMSVFGESNIAVRALSGVISLGSLTTVWAIARRLADRETAWIAVVLLGVSPFAVRYATETRMYSLVVLLSGLLVLLYLRVEERPSGGRLAALGAATGLLLLTHYWGFFYVAVGGALVLWRALRAGDPRPARRALPAMVLGSLLFLPWLPTFLTQMAHTGTPWGEPGRFTAVPAALGAYGGGINSIGGIGLGSLLAGFAGLAVVGRAIDGRRVEVDLLGRPVARELLALVIGTLTLAIVVGQLVQSAYSSRYAAVGLAAYIVLAAMGTKAFGDPRVRAAAVAAAAGFGLLASFPLVTDQRTQAVEVASVLNARAAPGDLVVFCPDQLGPAHNRLLRDDIRQVTFPLAGSPELVDWVDYADRQEGRSGARFGREMHRLAGDSTVFVVSAPGYATFGEECEAIARSLARLRTSDPFPLLVPLRDRYYERAQLFMYAPNPQGSSARTGPL